MPQYRKLEMIGKVVAIAMIVSIYLIVTITFESKFTSFECTTQDLRRREKFKVEDEVLSIPMK